MAYTAKLINKPGLTHTKKPAAALANGNRFVTLDTDPFSVVLSSADDNPYGVTLAPAAAAELIEIVKTGTVLVESGATDIGIGDYVMPGAAGVALKATTGKAVGGRCVAIIGTLAVGDLISVDLNDKKSLF
jgi:hypothetical protein